MQPAPGSRLAGRSPRAPAPEALLRHLDEEAAALRESLDTDAHG
ncbi:hypothetical protein ACFYXN_05610 [Streptomyces griseus]